jgi:hypothetical protein
VSRAAICADRQCEVHGKSAGDHIAHVLLDDDQRHAHIRPPLRVPGIFDSQQLDVLGLRILVVSSSESRGADKEALRRAHVSHERRERPQGIYIRRLPVVLAVDDVKNLFASRASLYRDVYLSPKAALPLAGMRLSLRSTYPGQLHGL